MKRGAKKFAMIGRSGLDKEPARRVVKDLEEAGAHVRVTRGDVGDATVVEEAVAAIKGEIGGVVQAAMGLDVRLFPSSISFALSLVFPSCPTLYYTYLSITLTQILPTGGNLDLHVQPILAHLGEAQSPRILESPQ